ncbi:MAG: hypothetical protein FJX77_17990, partial [Armatimonadetes bacterium]|nr:hypothetical protein [Armatimonadota bacterium]
RRLERAGVHVVYGLIGLKTHCKVLLVVRREAGEERLRRYVHLGTGNYNPSTARLYTDLGLLTCSLPIAQDASRLFNILTGFSELPRWRRLSVAPVGLRERVLELIGREREQALQGRPGRVIAAMNSLVDPEVIEALYLASQAGVQVDLIVRGICCLRSGVPGVSENIRVISLIGRYLEHSRILYFQNGGSEEVYLSSGDWMPRNLSRRVETMFPIEEPSLRQRVVQILLTKLSDNVQARELRPDGTYVRRTPGPGEERVDSQRYFQLQALAEHAEEPQRPFSAELLLSAGPARRVDAGAGATPDRFPLRIRPPLLTSVADEEVMPAAASVREAGRETTAAAST